MSYIRNYMIIALVFYGISVIKYFLQINLSGAPWYTLKTTNLHIMYYMERLCARTKKKFYDRPVITTRVKYMEDIKDKMSAYGLKRDKLYCVLICIIDNLKNIFWIDSLHKRNYLTLLLTILVTKRAKVMRLAIMLYDRSISGKGKGVAISYLALEQIKKIGPQKIEKAMLALAGIILICVLIKVFMTVWRKCIKKTKETKEGQLGKVQAPSNEILSTIQNKLGDTIILIVNKVREMDKLLQSKNTSENETELMSQTFKAMNGCEVIITDLRSKLAEIEQVKEIEIYGNYGAKCNSHLLALSDLNKEAASGKMITSYQDEVINGEVSEDEEILDTARDISYEYLKKAIEYYDELEGYLAKVNKVKREDRRKIYDREQMAQMKSSSEMIESYFEH